MNELQVPYGIDESGTLIKADNAKSDIDYFCPACSTKLVLRSGEIRARHFAHSVDANCSSESIMHKTAKYLIHTAITKNALGEENKLEIYTQCPDCQNCYFLTIPPKTFSFARLEVYVDSFICDVVAYKNDEMTLAVEVHYTNKVSAQKSKQLPIYWIELEAESIIKNSFKWQPIKSRLKKISCQPCKEKFKEIEKVATHWGVDKSLYSVKKEPEFAKYIAAIETCFKCEQDIPVFWWHGVPFCQTKPPEPKPKTIKYKYSKAYGGSYWANTCANCGVMQGDNHLYILEDAVLDDLPLSNMDEHLEGQSQSAADFMMDVIKRNFY